MAANQIGRYIIESELARGGMGKVYLALDPNTNRKVALKVLASELTLDSHHRSRFQNEARIIAALEHKNIVPVYDFGEHRGQLYIVMRHISGGTLSERIKAGTITLREATRILSCIASALDYAHSEGVIHRDLKPSNILFDRFNEVQLTDFGLARFTLSPSRLTASSSGILGTPQYMSPEQWKEEDATSRSDIYTLGVILYEMLTGELPYRSEMPVRLMQMHIAEPPPDLASVRPDLPPACGAVIARAMAKDPAERFATAGEMLRAWEEALAGLPAETWNATPRSPVPSARRGSQPPASPQAALPHPNPNLQSPPPGTGYRSSPSPASGRLSQPSHPSQVNARQVSWLVIVLAGMCLILTAAGITSLAIFKPWKGASPARTPTLLPSATVALATPGSAFPTASPTPTTLPSPAGTSRPLPTSTFPVSLTVVPVRRTFQHVAAVINGSIFLYDLGKDQYLIPRTNDATRPSLSTDGKRIAFASNRFGQWDVFLASTDGTSLLRLTDAKANNYDPCLSPDGRLVVFTSTRDGNEEIYLLEIQSDKLTRLTNHPAADFAPVWSPDGKFIAFVSRRDGNAEIYRMDPDGSNLVNLTNAPATDDLSPSYSADNSQIVYTAAFRLALLDLRTGEKSLLTFPEPLRKEIKHLSPSFAPEGYRIAYIRFLDSDNVSAYDLCVYDPADTARPERCYEQISRKVTAVSWIR
ncbi:MAG TPA: protein kinase [Anaerolineaceae bacterium]